mmetsp:Transcript_78468/g.91726  ORF Transcript_78468/g.91726 Transcript_78468/m.91726 type:complete len:280 (+) Transcript_78468:257-1096(+)
MAHHSEAEESCIPDHILEWMRLPKSIDDHSPFNSLTDLPATTNASASASTITSDAMQALRKNLESASVQQEKSVSGSMNSPDESKLGLLDPPRESILCSPPAVAEVVVNPGTPVYTTAAPQQTAGGYQLVQTGLGQYMWLQQAPVQQQLVAVQTASGVQLLPFPSHMMASAAPHTIAITPPSTISLSPHTSSITVGPISGSPPPPPYVTVKGQTDSRVHRSPEAAPKSDPRQGTRDRAGSHTSSSMSLPPSGQHHPSSRYDVPSDTCDTAAAGGGGGGR